MGTFKSDSVVSVMKNETAEMSIFLYFSETNAKRSLCHQFLMDQVLQTPAKYIFIYLFVALSHIEQPGSYCNG